MKAQAFDRFQRGGSTEALITDMRALGAAWSTARSWLSTFRLITRVVRAVRKQDADGGSK